MTSVSSYPKRLIEVDLPIKKISEHARREKSIRHGHISTLHIWWARRPLAACRAVICASLWPDPADFLCPESFKAEAKKQMAQFWNQMDEAARNVNDPIELRKALLDFIADFAIWDNSTDERYLSTAHKLTQSAHEALGGERGTRPIVVDPFAGGGSIPLEALRVGADCYASDLNPVAVLLNKVVLEYIPKYGQELADEVRKWGQWVKEEADKELAEFYPNDIDGSIPIAYLWARTIRCEGPGCGAEVPLIRSLWLSKRGERSVAIRLMPDISNKKVNFEIIKNIKSTDVKNGTVKRGSATCPCCGYTTPVTSVRVQLRTNRGGADSARMFCVVLIKKGQQGRSYRLPTERDREAALKGKIELQHRIKNWNGDLSLIPNERLPPQGTLGFRVQLYGMETWGDLFSSRQALALSSFTRLVQRILPSEENKKIKNLASATQLCLALAVDSCADHNASLCTWRPNTLDISHVFGRQALPISWDFAEVNAIGGSTGSFEGTIDKISRVISRECVISNSHAQVIQSSATTQSLPNDFVDAFITDPPYYDAVPYADLSDFFYVWLRRSLSKAYLSSFETILTPKDDECIVDPIKGKDRDFFEKMMALSMKEGRRILKPNGLGLVVFAHKSTEGWEAQLKAIMDAGWIITASWPIDTEMGGRLRAMDSAALASSIHLVCRPRENLDGAQQENTGEWSDVLAELPLRIHEWMPRLKQENVVGADAIFSCLGPALEIFSRYSSVEKASGEQVTLKEYLEKVWEAVEKEALTMIFECADVSGFEEDARLTAMWLWTLKAGANGDSSSTAAVDEAEVEDDSDESAVTKPAKILGYGLEYDAARKISQGLGAHPEEMPTLIEIKKGNARLLSVAERASYLFGKQDLAPKRKVKKREMQLTLFPGETTSEETATVSSLGELSAIGKTTLDRVHQSMLLFGNGQSEALKRFLVEEGIGKDQQFKKLAQALVALYPGGSDEKRWAEGVMSRMKGLGL